MANSELETVSLWMVAHNLVINARKTVAKYFSESPRSDFRNTVYGIFEYFHKNNSRFMILKHLKFLRYFDLFLNDCESYFCD